MPPKEKEASMKIDKEEQQRLLNNGNIHPCTEEKKYGTSMPDDVKIKLNNNNVGENETKNDKTSSYQSWLMPFYFNIFFACASFSIVMPSLAPYLSRMNAPLSFLSYVVSAYAVGEMIGSILFGYYYEWSVQSLPLGLGPKSSMISCIVVGMIGSLGYVVADLGLKDSPHIVLWSRFVQGLWTGGQQTIEQSYLSAAVSSDERTEYTATLSTFAVLGFVIGPSFGALCSNVNFTLFRGDDGSGGWVVDAYNAPGLFIFVINCFMLVNTGLFFDGKDDKTALVDKNSEGDSSLYLLEDKNGGKDEMIAAPVQDNEISNEVTARTEKQEQKRNYIGLSICILLFFVHYYSFAVQETIITPWVIHDYNWDPLRVNLLFVGAGILSLIASIIVKYASRILDDRFLLLFSALIGLVGSVLLVDYPTKNEDTYGIKKGLIITDDTSASLTTTTEDIIKANIVSIPQFLIGFSLITLAFPFGRNVTLGVYGNVLGPINQGRWMGLMLAVSAVPRALGPFVAVSLLEQASWYTYLEFGLVAILFGVGCLLNLLYWNKLIPFEEEEEKEQHQWQQQQSQQWERDEMIPTSPMPHNSPAIRRHRSLSIKRNRSDDYDRESSNVNNGGRSFELP